jgi:Heparinase II/III-like protein/Heparinase II/III N-terminus
MLTDAFRYYMRRAVALPPRATVRAAAIVLNRAVATRLGRRRDVRRRTFADEFPRGPLLRYFPALDDCARVDALRGVSEEFLAHRFNLLGSGWVQVRHGMQCAGIEGYRYDSGRVIEADRDGRWLMGRINLSNLRECQRVWRLIDHGYTAIDWHLDFKSGYRWPEGAWYRDITRVNKPGVDIKVPRELARMQHLPLLARAYAAATDAQGFHTPDVYWREFRNQVLDFVATNPPRFGVNWECTMDVGIRVANWLAAYDMFTACGVTTDDEFNAVFKRSIYEHARHVATNLEWYEVTHTNHYFANVTALLFAAAYLPRTAETDVWLAFSVQELINEVDHQFGADGANFEGSTSYHQLAAEMAAYATALVLGLPAPKLAALREYDYRLHQVRPPLKPAPLPFYPLAGTLLETVFPAWYMERLEKMAEFTLHISKPNATIPQIGDNDSGHFLNLDPPWVKRSLGEAVQRYANLGRLDGPSANTVYWDRQHLEHRRVVGAINALFARADLAAFVKDANLETRVLRALATGVHIRSYAPPKQSSAAEQFRIGNTSVWEDFHATLASASPSRCRTKQIALPGADLRDGLKLYAYPDFGLYLYRSPRLYLAVRCAAANPQAHGAHAHNDQLSIELNVDGQDLITDPGTYLYTPFPAQRNRYRSVNAHFAPQYGGREPCRLDLGLFKLEDSAQAHCLYFGENGFIGTHRGFGEPVYRVIAIGADSVTVTDCFEAVAVTVDNAVHSAPPFSPAYGVAMRDQLADASHEIAPQVRENAVNA